MKINMGCGWRNFGADWIHIDGGDYEHLDHKDICDLSQFENNSVKLIYASHVLEYFDEEEALNVLMEWKRILKLGGTLRLAVPDFEVMCRLYSENTYGLEKFIGPLYGKVNMGEKKVYHKMAYDTKTLKNLLIEKAKFKNFKTYDWKQTEHSSFDDHSQAYLPHMDKANGTLISLNVECNK